MRRHRSESTPKVFECPNCGSARVETEVINDKFQYGSGDGSVELEVSVPLRKCLDCHFEYTDSETEDLRHEAVCRHLGLMSPREIAGLRKAYGLTRAQFAEISRIGEASLARWETGEVIQNPGNDAYLYLLSFPENLEHLKKRYAVCRVGEGAAMLLETRVPIFRSVVGAVYEEKSIEACAFRL